MSIAVVKENPPITNHKNLHALAVGAKVGAIQFVAESALEYIADFFIPDPFVDEKEEEAYEALILKTPVDTCLISPIIEEIVFRGILLMGLYLLLNIPFLILSFISSPHLSTLSEEIKKLLRGKSKNKTFLIASIISSFLFGLAHLPNFGSLFQSVGCFFFALIQCLLYGRFGMLAPISCHAVNNTLALICLAIAKAFGFERIKYRMIKV